MGERRSDSTDLRFDNKFSSADVGDAAGADVPNIRWEAEDTVEASLTVLYLRYCITRSLPGCGLAMCSCEKTASDDAGPQRERISALRRPGPSTSSLQSPTTITRELLAAG